MLKLPTINEQIITVPVSNAKLEIMLSKVKCVKIDFCCSLSVKRLEIILRIMEEGSSWEINK